MDDAVVRFADRLLAGDRRALSRAISFVENADPRGNELFAHVFPNTGRASSIGLTGPPGVGKSTLTSALVATARARDESVGVLAVDPSSSLHTGAFLGDRVRLGEHFLDPAVFIRSMASRGALGGLARATAQAHLLMDAAGFDLLLLETLGVGQAEIDIAEQADTVVLLLMPGAGDAIQALKSGIMEIPDIIVITRGDEPRAKEARRHVKDALLLRDKEDSEPSLILVEALAGTGMEELEEAIANHRRFLAHDGRLEARRRHRLEQEVQSIAVEEFTKRMRDALTSDPEFASLLDAVTERRLDPVSAATRIVEAMS